MRVTDYFIIGLFGLVTSARGLITNAPICQCQTADCCNVDDATATKFTGATGVRLTYPEVSFTGKYTVINQLQYNETAGADYNSTQDYQYVVFYDNDFKNAFDRNLFFYTAPSQNISCTESHVYVGDPGSDYYKKIDLIEQDDGMGNTYCIMDIIDKLTIAEINTDAEVYFAFNRLVNENSVFNIGYDMSASGLIVPISDITVYPYVIKQNSVFGTDEFGNGEFYIDLRLNVSDVDTSTVEIPAACLSVDEMMLTEAYWFVPGGTNCPVNVLVNGTGDLEDTASGRTYHLQIKQTEYETCSFATRELGGEIHFDFRLVLPIDNTLTTDVSDDADECYYFAENLHVQNVTISMDQDVTSTITSEYITDFEPAVTSMTPVRCTDYDVYPTPHSTLKIEITAAFPGVNTVDFQTIGIPTFGETWESNLLEWDDPNGNPSYLCTTHSENVTIPEDDYQVCVFKFVSTVCERLYETSTGECAFERNTTRFVTGFQIEQEITGGLSAFYNAGPINSGIDNTVFPADTCGAPTERAVVDVSDLFEVGIDLRNYYLGTAVDWANSSLLTMKDDMIGRLTVKNSVNTPVEFQDLSLIIKTATVSLTNPLTNEQITSYTFSVNDKKDFMDFSWTPYYKDPRFCAFYNADAAGDKCEKFFQDDRLNNNYHNPAWVTSHEGKECQREDTLVDEVDTKNSDHFLFTPREWFRDNVNGYVTMTVTLSGSVHQCVGSRRMLSETGETGLRHRALQAARDVLFISDQIIVTFVTDAEGNEHVEVVKPDTKSWWEESQTAIIIGAVIIGLIVLVMLFTWMHKRSSYDSLSSGLPYGLPMVISNSASRPDF
jgi:hypothetical protein